MALPVVSSAKGVTFRVFQLPASRSFVSRGRPGPLWHSNMLHDVSKVVVRGRRNTFAMRGRRNTFATFSEDALHLSQQAQHFGDLPCHFAWQSQHFRRVVLRLFCELHCQRFAKWWQGANCVHSTLYTLHFTLYIPHSTLYTPHSTLYTPHSTLYTPHSTLYTLHPTLYTPQSILYTLHSTLYTSHSTLYTLHLTLETPHFKSHTPHFTLHNQHSTLSTFHSTLYTPFLFSHNFDSGVPSHTCEHSGSWASSCFFELGGTHSSCHSLVQSCEMNTGEHSLRYRAIRDVWAAGSSAFSCVSFFDLRRLKSVWIELNECNEMYWRNCGIERQCCSVSHLFKVRGSLRNFRPIRWADQAIYKASASANFRQFTFAN